MKRNHFLKLLALAPLSAAAMKLSEFYKSSDGFVHTERMPVLFVGHGSPMNAIEQNSFSAKWGELGKNLPKPTAILCISAHWETRGTFVTAMPNPPTIHDFGGFPQALFDVQYQAPGNPELAKITAAAIRSTQVQLDQDWGLDHGCWSILNQMYPNADIPVLQLSLDYTKPMSYHFELAKELAFLREKGVLIIGSGNMVHNLGKLNWQQAEGGYDWAVEANAGLKDMILNEDIKALTDVRAKGQAYQLSIPTPEHYLPMLYSLGLRTTKDELSFFNDSLQMGSISMTSVLLA
jgi:4,5-DOPA dioxygenase extradiol